MLAAASAAAGGGTMILAVTILTSLDDEDLGFIGYSLPAGQAAIRLADLAVSAGIGGIVCSAKEAGEIRRRFGQGVVLVTPGVRLPEDSIGDQKRVTTPSDAVQAGADYIVVGRPITKAPDPVAAARKFAAAMAGGGDRGGARR